MKQYIIMVFENNVHIGFWCGHDISGGIFVKNDMRRAKPCGNKLWAKKQMKAFKLKFTQFDFTVMEFKIIEI
jgi:hypothetical protein